MKITVPNSRMFLMMKYSPWNIWVGFGRNKQAKVNNPVASGMTGEVPKRWMFASAITSPIAGIVECWKRVTITWMVRITGFLSAPHCELLHARFPYLRSVNGAKQGAKFSPIPFNINIFGLGKVGWVKEALLFVSEFGNSLFRHNGVFVVFSGGRPAITGARCDLGGFLL